MDKITKTFISEIKSINANDFTLEAVISDETIDRYGEVIKIDSWKKRLGRYKAQAVLLSSHKYDKLTNQIGKAESVSIKDGKLVAKFKYFTGAGNPEADWGWKLASEYGMAAYSVGFLPHKYEDKEFDEDVKSGKKPCREYTDVELLEVSQVLIPANPSAMMRSIEEEDDVVLKDYLDIMAKNIEASYVPEDLEIIEEKDAEDVIITKPDTTNYVHIGVSGEEGKHSGHAIKTIMISAKEGIKGHYCTEETCKKITGYMFDKEKGWTHEKAQTWVDSHTKEFDEYLWLSTDIKEDELALLDYPVCYDEIELFKEWKGIKNKEIKKEEDVNGVIDAIKELKDSVEKRFEQLDSFMKDYEQFFNLEAPNDEIIEDEINKEVEDENYIKKLLEETNDIISKTISVQSK